MNLRSNTGLRRWGTRFVLGTALLSTIAGAVAIRSLMARPGEGALRFVPADAVFVSTIDLSPSAAQTLAFKRIDDALARNGLDKLVDSSIIEIFEGNNPVAKEIGQYVKRNMAVALLPNTGAKGNQDVQGVAFLALSDPDAVAKLLASKGAVRYFKGTKYYVLPHGKSPMMVVDDVLAVSQQPEGMWRVRQIRDGVAQPITKVDAFVAARSHVADDANAMLFVSPAFAQSVGAKEFSDYSTDWMSMGLAIRDGGIGMSFAGTVNTKKYPEFATVGRSAPIRADLYDVLPAGAYAVMAYSQPANYFEAFEGAMGRQKDGKKMIVDMEKGTKDAIGLDLKKDIVTAMRGNFVLAAYPTQEKPAGGVDVLLVMDDSNGADPAAAVERLQAHVEKQMEKEGEEIDLYQARPIEGGKAFRLSEEVESEFREGFTEEMSGDVVRKDLLMSKKTLAWAIVGKAVFASSNQDLLDRALTAYRSKSGSLRGDAKYAEVEREVVDGSQQMAMFSLSRIAEGVRHTMNTKKMDKKDAKMFDDILSAFESLGQPFTTKGKIQPDGRMAGGAFIPLDYGRVIDFIGEARKK